MTRHPQQACGVAVADPPVATSLPPAAPAACKSRRWRSAELLGGGHEVEIEHGQVVYRLRQTSLGKLILTK
jgi:hemin uptake protein HemP